MFFAVISHACTVLSIAHPPADLLFYFALESLFPPLRFPCTDFPPSSDGARGEDGTREEKTWKQQLENEVEKEVCRRMRDREASRRMADDNDEHARNPRQHERHRELRGQIRAPSTVPDE